MIEKLNEILKENYSVTRLTDKAQKLQDIMSYFNKDKYGNPRNRKTWAETASSLWYSFDLYEWPQEIRDIVIDAVKKSVIKDLSNPKLVMIAVTDRSMMPFRVTDMYIDVSNGIRVNLSGYTKRIDGREDKDSVSIPICSYDCKYKEINGYNVYFAPAKDDIFNSGEIRMYPGSRDYKHYDEYDALKRAFSIAMIGESWLKEEYDRFINKRKERRIYNAPTYSPSSDLQSGRSYLDEMSHEEGYWQ